MSGDLVGESSAFLTVIISQNKVCCCTVSLAVSFDIFSTSVLCTLFQPLLHSTLILLL